MTTYPFSILGALCFIAFLLFAVLRRIGGGPAPYRALARLHLFFAVVYPVACLIWIEMHPGGAFSWADGLLGLYVYFALQYAFFTHVFGTILRGFSTEICIALYREGGRASLSKIQSSYNGGKGLDFVKNERIGMLLESGALLEKNGALTVTSFGRFAAVLNRCLLKLWNLGYLGVQKVSPKS